MKILNIVFLLIFVSCSSQKVIHGKYICAYCPNGDKTYKVVLDKNETGMILTTIHRPPRMIDTIRWQVCIPSVNRIL